MKIWWWVAIRRHAIVFLALGFVALHMSCSENNCVTVCDQDNSCPDRPSPDQLLQSVAYAYEHKDLDLYSVIFSEFYHFEFSETHPDTIAPDSTRMTKTEDIVSTRNLFNDPDVKDIEMTIHPQAGALWEECYREVVRDDVAGGETEVFEGLCMRFEPDIKVQIEQLGEEPEMLWVKDSLLDIMLVPDLDCPGDWVILWMTETRKGSTGMSPCAPGAERAGGLASSARITTWSAIKLSYR